MWERNISKQAFRRRIKDKVTDSVREKRARGKKNYRKEFRREKIRAEQVNRYIEGKGKTKRQILEGRKKGKRNR